MVTWYPALLAAIAVERLAEIAVSRRHSAWARAHGAVEGGQTATAPLIAAHALFLPVCALEVILAHRPLLPALAAPMLAVTAGAQALRWWSVRALGPAWSFRVMAVPDAPAIREGPYRWIRHPNYLAVIAEVAAVPLVHTAWITALGFSAVNGLLIGRKIRDEEALLSRTGDYRSRLAGRPALWPRLLRRRRAAQAARRPAAGARDAPG